MLNLKRVVMKLRACLLCCGPINHSARYYFIIDCTLPTLPSVSRTLIPWG
jgi:hypothetical protein